MIRGEKRPQGKEIRCSENRSIWEKIIYKDMCIYTCGIAPNQSLCEHKLSTVHSVTAIFKCKHKAFLHLESKNLNIIWS